MKKHIGIAAFLIVISVDCFARGGSAPYRDLNFFETLLACVFGIPLLVWFYWQVFVVGTYEIIKDAISKVMPKKQPKPTTPQIKPHTPQPKTNHINTSVPDSQPFQKTQQIKAIREVVRPSTYQPKELTGFQPQK